MSNPNHLPPGIPEGGQFTFAKVGGLAFEDGFGAASPQSPERSPWEPAVINPAYLSDDEKKHITDTLKELGYTGDDILTEALDGKDPSTLSPEERARIAAEYSQKVYKEGLIHPLERSLSVAMQLCPEVLEAGGNVVGLAHDNGTYQIGHTLTGQMEDILNNMPPLDEGEMYVYNPGTGTLRQGGGYGVPVGKPIVVPPGATSSKINGLIDSAATKIGRDIGSSAYAGRMMIGVTTDQDGNVLIQPTIHCEANEKGIAEGYAKKLGVDVNTVLKPGDIVNPIAYTDIPGSLHTTDFHSVKGNFGNIQTGRMNQKDIPNASKEMMVQMHRKMQEERKNEVGRKEPSPEQKAAKKKRDSENAKKRRERTKLAKEEAAKGREPIKVKNGWLMKGERGYEAAYAQSVKDGASSVGFNARAANITVAEARAADNQSRRQKSRRSDRRYKERKQQIREAHENGQKCVKYYPSGKNRKGEVEIAVEGDKNYEKALKNPTCKFV